MLSLLNNNNMKIYADRIHTEDLSEFSDEELKSWGIYSREHAQKPIALSDINVELNEDGNVLITFKTNNHKYLNVEYNTSTSARIDEDYKNKPWSSKGLEISSHEEYQAGDYGDGKPMMLPISRMMIWLEPDTQEENDALSGIACDLASKWGYEIVILPYDKFYAPDDNRRDPIEKLEEDYVYTVDLFNK